MNEQDSQDLNADEMQISTSVPNVEFIKETQVVVDERYIPINNSDDCEICYNCGEEVDMILPHLIENRGCSIAYRQRKNVPLDSSAEFVSERIVPQCVTKIVDDGFNGICENLRGLKEDVNILKSLCIEQTNNFSESMFRHTLQKIRQFGKQLRNCELQTRTGCGPYSSILQHADRLDFSSTDDEECEDDEREYLDEHLMHFIRKENLKPVTEKVCLRKSYSAPRRNYIQKTPCKHCGALSKYILSHLSKSFRCQVDYDMTKLREEAADNKRLRQKHYERQYFAEPIPGRANAKKQRNKFESQPKFTRKFSSSIVRSANGSVYRISNKQMNRSHYYRNLDKLRAKHRDYNAVYRKRMKNKQMILELKQYHKEMEDKGIDVKTCQEVIKVTQDIIQSSVTGETPSKAPIAEEARAADTQITKFRPPNKVFKLTQGGKEGDVSDIEVLEEEVSDAETSTLHIE